MVYGKHDPDMTDLLHSPSELTDAELAVAIRFWRKNRCVVSGAATLAMHVDEQRRRRAGSLGEADARSTPGCQVGELTAFASVAWRGLPIRRSGGVETEDY